MPSSGDINHPNGTLVPYQYMQWTWSVKLDAATNANPMTYPGKSGKQYVAIVSGGAIHTWALP